MGYNFLDRIKILFNLIVSSPFFLAIVSIFLLTTFVLILYNRIKTKSLKYVVAFGYLLIAMLILLKYGNSIINLMDSLVDQVFSFLYFPNIIAYICMIIICILSLIATFVKKNIKTFPKTLNIIVFAIIIILFILTLDVIVSNNINIYEKTEIYSNETLVVLIEASTFIFIIWAFSLFVSYIVDIINNKQVKNTFHQMEEKINNEVNVIELETIELENMSDEEFMKSIKNKKNLYKDIFKN